ncbi:MAG: wax ester/triacylglycerol synthase family O-acyltransferase, partial [Myxococcota bacterium]|nr:wax ester/triacylglycerol synthase family O-acyltransferase [Myxococcota bacterium]
DPIGAAPPRWEDDPDFDLGYHVRRVRAPGAGTLRDLLDVATPLVMQAFDKDRPLWELTEVEGLAQGRHGLLLKIHHAISDGVGLVRMTSSLVERSREARPGREVPLPRLGEREGTEGADAFSETLGALRYRMESNLGLGARGVGALGAGLRRALLHPLDSAGQAVRMAGSVAKLLRPVSEPLSPVMRGRSTRLRLDALFLPLADLKQAARAVGGTLNDAFVAAVAGGLRLYHEEHGTKPSELRMTMPINLRSGEEGRRAGNQFAPARFAVPVDVVDPAERMQEIGLRVRRERDEPALPLVDEVASMLGRLPQSMSVPLFGSMLKAVDFVTSNVPGPPFPVFASGAHVERMVGFGPLSGSALNVTLFSYDGGAALGISSDRTAVPDGERLVACLERGLDEVRRVGGQGPA